MASQGLCWSHHDSFSNSLSLRKKGQRLSSNIKRVVIDICTPPPLHRKQNKNAVLFSVRMCNTFPRGQRVQGNSYPRLSFNVQKRIAYHCSLHLSSQLRYRGNTIYWFGISTMHFHTPTQKQHYNQTANIRDN